MKQVQQALASLGIHVQVGIWRSASADQNTPAQYVVYSTTRTEASHHDDAVTAYKTFIYLNLWSVVDPSETADRLRQLMCDYGFVIVEESDKGYNQPAYDTATRQFTIQWTWLWREEVRRNAP